jgi:hypothetical protein
MMKRGMMGRRFALSVYCLPSNLIEAQTYFIFNTVLLLSVTEIFSDFYLAFLLEFGIVYCYSSLSHSSIISLDYGLYDATWNISVSIYSYMLIYMGINLVTHPKGKPLIVDV